MLKVLIADGNDEFRMSLEGLLGTEFAVRTAASGKQTLDALHSFQPDILILDVMLPGQDGIALLQEARMARNRPMVLAITCLLSEYVVSSLNRIGVSYVLVRPCELNAVVLRVRDFADFLKTGERSGGRTVAQMMNHLGLSQSHKGYRYLEHAVPALAEDFSQSITKELYVSVAKTTGGQPKQVERAMRSAIAAAWEKRDNQIWSAYFQPDAHGRIPKPTNKHFISRLAEMLDK